MSHTLSRRDFLKASAALTAALSLPAWFPAAQPARGRSNQLGELAPSLAAVNSQLPTNQPIADIAAGWDGALWVLDSIGVPHLFDPLAQTWQPFGRGVDAATKIGDTFYLFRDDEVALYDLQQGLVSLQTIGALWPQLPATFQSNLDGAFANGQTIYLCRSGRYVSADLSSSPVTFSQPIPLSTWYAWPTTAPWDQGVIAKAGTWIDSSLPAAFFFPVQSPPAEFVLAFLVQGGAANLDPIAEVGNTIPPAANQIVDLLAAGDFDAYVTQTNGPRIPNEHWVFQGPILWNQTNTDQNIGAVTPIALASWVPAWFPQLAQAPRGRVGNLWGLTPGGGVLYHDGIGWQSAPALSGATVISLDVGEDGIPFAIATGGGGGAALYPFDPATMSWQQPVALGAIMPKQVAVGDATRVYVLDTGGAVSKLENNSFVPVGTLPAGITQLTANHDGTLWHCDGSSPNAFRFISERPYQATVPVPNVTSVQRVASTAYGNALMLVQQAGASQLYTYDSPFLFKTSPSFVPLANGRVLQNPQVTPGGGRCFVNVGSGIVALDSRTGEELWAQALPNQGQCASIIYDPPHRLLYATDNAHMLFALDAATGAERWSYQVIGTVGQPVLSGGGLCVVGQMDAGVNVYWFNTAAALSQAAANQTVTPVWQQEVGDGIPVLSTVYVDAGYVYLVLILTDIMSTAEGVVRLNVTDGSAPTVLYTYGLAGQGGNGDWNGNVATAVGRQIVGETQNQLLFSNTSDGVQVFPLLPTGAFVPINAPPANGFTEGVACTNNAVYVCGTNGVLYTLDLSQPLNSGSAFQPVPQQAPISGGSFGAGPVVASTAAGALIAFSMSAGGRNSVCLYDPADGNLLQLDTDQMLATQLISDDDGILYAAGLDPANPSDPFGQVYAIRIDEILQQERAFIVESELMQDFDEPASGQLAATARYQTHVTIVDALKAPRPFQAVKVWADSDKATPVLIDGVAYTIDATTPAVVQTDATGSLTIVSDATDLSTTALKLWAGFMNFYERIVIYPDREFHSRLTTTHADASSASPDPTRINLATATTYDVNNLTDPPTLFKQNEQAQAGAAAGAVKQLTTAVGYPNGVTTSGRQARTAAPAAHNYLAYSDLPGAAYGPINTPANRMVSALAVTGFTGFSYDGTSVTPLSVADAANAIDALDGQTLAAPGSFWSALSGLWDKIKNGAAKIGQIVVSIGKDIYAGLKYIEAGVEKVLRQVLHDIEDVAIIIGSIFIQLGKLLADVAEALSLIFHLKEVLATAGAIKSVFTTMTTNLAAAIGSAATTVNTFFTSAETTIDDAFAKITASLGGAATASPVATAAGGIGGLQGIGATPHTVFTVGPKTSTQNSSQAVPAMWGVHKLRQNYAQGTSQTMSAGAAAAGSDPLTQFLQSFFADASNATQVSQFKDSYHGRIRFGSAKEFFASALVDLLDALEALINKLLSLLNGLLDGVINNASAVVGLLGAEGGVQIPILSTIWHALTGNTLTFLDLIAFVVAIPVTLVYRIVEGSYPSVQLLAAGAAQTATTVLARVQGISSTVADVLAGFFNAIFDSISIAGGEQTLLSTIINVIVSIDLASNLVIGDVLTPEVWVIVASIISLLMLVLNAIPGLPSELPSITGVALSPLLLVAYWQIYAKSQESSTDALGLSANVIGALPAIVNPIKFAPLTTPAPLVAPIADLACGVAAAGLTLGATIAGWDASAPPTALPDTEEPAAGTHRVFMPAIMEGK